MDLETVRPNVIARDETWSCVYKSEAVSLRDGTAVTIRPTHAADSDCEGHVALVATSNQGRAEVIVGTAKYVTRSGGESGLAEPAIEVADAFQNKGLGMLLLIKLVALARERGIHAFYGHISLC